MIDSKQQSPVPLLEVRDLCMSFPGQRQLVIDHVNFSIHPGRTMGLVGSSGAGKSSIARVIMHLVKPVSGDIRFKGNSIFEMDTRQLKEYRQNVQMVFQDPSTSLSPKRTIEASLLEPLVHFDIGSRSQQQAKIRSTLNTVGLDQDVLTRYPRQFSTGQQQRICIARALVTGPELLIADEAVSSLDVSIQAQILELLQTLKTDHGITLLFISHDLAVVKQLADELAVMYRGQLLEQCPCEQFFQRPAHPYSRALLSFAGPDALKAGSHDYWRLQSGRESSGMPSACIFANNCPEQMTKCHRFEPGVFKVQYENQDTLSAHCVKCHLYETQTDETIKTSA